MDGGRAMNDTERPEPAADAVHAVHEALVNSAPDWIIDREDGELLGMARAALQAAAVEPEPGLDELLDDVEAAFVSILWREDVGLYEVAMHGHSSAWFARGTGKTRTEALVAAVQQAKENGDG